MAMGQCKDAVGMSEGGDFAVPALHPRAFAPQSPSPRVHYYTRVLLSSVMSLGGPDKRVGNHRSGGRGGAKAAI